MLFFLSDVQNSSPKAALQALQVKKEKRAFLLASFSWSAYSSSKAGITVEAALVLPVFLFALLWLPYSLIVMGTQVRIQQALEQSAMEIARYGQVGDVLSEDIELPDMPGNLSGSVYGSFRTASILGYENVKNSCIKNGELLVVDKGEDGMVELCANYPVEIPFFPAARTVWMQQKSRRRAWSGRDEDMVYITKTGSVYHLYLDCTYIRHNPRAVSLSAIEKQQNSDGDRYTPCRICCKGGVGSGTVYITTEGNHYHSSAACSGICKEVIAIPITEVGDRPLCSRCGAR